MTNINLNKKPAPFFEFTSFDLFNILIVIGIFKVITAITLSGNFDQNILCSMFTYQLPATIGFAICMRYKILDLTVWMNIAIGSLVATYIINTGSPENSVNGTPANFPVITGIICAAITTGIIGLVNAFITSRTKFKSWFVTLISGILIFVGLIIFMPSKKYFVNEFAFDNLVNKLDNILNMTPKDSSKYEPLSIFEIKLFAMKFLFFVSIVSLSIIMYIKNYWRVKNKINKNYILLPISGMLAGISGFMWVFKHGYITKPNLFFDNLQIPIIALLAGAAFLRGKNHTIVSIILIPFCIVIVSQYNMIIKAYYLFNINITPIILLAQILIMQLAMSNLIRKKTTTYSSLSSAILSVIAFIVPFLTSPIYVDFHIKYLPIYCALLSFISLSILLFDIKPINKKSFYQLLRNI